MTKNKIIFTKRIEGAVYAPLVESIGKVTMTMASPKAKKQLINIMYGKSQPHTFLICK